MSTPRLSPVLWPLLALIASVSMLAGAHSFEIFGKMGPCALCLRQREVYWAAIGVAIAGYGFWRLRRSPRILLTLNVLLALVFLIGAIIAIYHAGVEWKFWPGPVSCSGPIGGAVDFSGGIDLDQKFETISCSEAPWRLFGISMAGYNGVISLVLAGLSFFAAFRVTSPSQAT